MTDDSRRPPIGAVGQQVVRNVRQLMTARGLSLRALYERLGDVGRPILPTVLHRLTSGTRRVDADDLIALSIALGVSPSALLLPRDALPSAEVDLAPEARVTAWAAWAWADGRMPLPGGGDAPSARFAREADFATHARPAFSAHGGTEAVSELYELADRVEAFLGAGDVTVRGALRDRVLRQVRQVVLSLEETLADDAAAAQLRDAARTLPAPVVDWAPGTEAGR